MSSSHKMEEKDARALEAHSENGQEHTPLLHRKVKILTILKVLACIFLIGLASLLLYTRFQGNGSYPVFDHDNEQMCDDGLPCNAQFSSPTMRYEIDSRRVACWPSTGGVWVKDMSAVELQHIGIDRFEDTMRSEDPQAEDDFCKRLQTYGADWYELPATFDNGRKWCWDLTKCARPQIRVQAKVGFPAEGGAWMFDNRLGWDLDPYTSGGISEALTMEERCDVIRRKGGEYYKDINSMPFMKPKVNQIDVEMDM